MIIQKVIFAGLVASAGVAFAAPMASKPVEPDAIERVANIVEPIGKELVGLTALPTRTEALAPSGAIKPASATLAQAGSNAGMVRQLNIEVDAPHPATIVSSTATPLKEDDINLFLLLALLVGAILLRRRAE